MTTRIDEIAPHIYRISTFAGEAAPNGLCFNQFLVDDDDPVLVHTGMRMHAEATIAAVSSVLAPKRIRWITSGHASRPDEYGALDAWFAVSPHAQVFHGTIGCQVNLSDVSDRPLRPMDDDDVVETGEHRFRWLSTPHVPGPWEAGVVIEETTDTMFCGDLLAQGGDHAALSNADVVGPAIELELWSHGTARTPDTAPTLRRLANHAPATLALMHGPAYTGDTTDALNQYATWLDES